MGQKKYLKYFYLFLSKYYVKHRVLKLNEQQLQNVYDAIQVEMNQGYLCFLG